MACTDRQSKGKSKGKGGAKDGTVSAAFVQVCPKVRIAGDGVAVLGAVAQADTSSDANSNIDVSIVPYS
jgi:hypothetical protein